MVHVDKLIYPLPVGSHPWLKSPRIVSTLEAVASRAMPKPSGSRRVYVSRNRYHKRRLVNEREILRVCAAMGFETVYREQMSFAEQVDVFGAAKIVIGNCGAGLTNMAFQPRGSHLLALASEHMHDSFFWDLASLKDIRYVSLHGPTVGDAAGLQCDEQVDLDFTIDVECFGCLVEDLVATSSTWLGADRVPVKQASAGEDTPRLTWR